MINKVYLSQDGNWGSAEGLLVFDDSQLTEELREMLHNDPEGAYDEIHEFLHKEE